MGETATLQIEIGVAPDKAKQLLALVEAASEANRGLQSALEHLAEAFRDGSLVLVNSADPGKIIQFPSLPASASDDIPLAD